MTTVPDRLLPSSGRVSRRQGCVALAALVLMPARANVPHPGTQLRGRGTLRFLGLAIYEARLWTLPTFEAASYASQPFTLELVYARGLDGAAIVERSLLEMRRQEGFDPAREPAWRALMQQAFPDTAAGDRLAGANDGDGGVRFLHNGRVTAQARDADFARLFFGIWLSPRTSEPGLRRALLAMS
jgi:hypothetical protein